MSIAICRRAAREACEQALELAAAPAARSAFITVTAARARREADASDARRRAGRRISPLDGVTIAWKDLFDVAGTVTTCGSATRASAAPAPSDSALVRRAHAAGLVTLGKTNLSEFAFSGLGINHRFGTPINPVDAALVPGGSSSGAAVCAALGIARIAVGTDTSGSVRVPAAFSGCIGFRASRHRYGVDDFVALSPTLDSVGVLARTVDDIRAFDRTFAIEAGMDDSTPPRFVIPEGEWIDDCTDGVRAAFEHAVQVLRRKGFHVDTARLDALQAAQRLLDVHGTIVGAEAYATLGHLLAAPGGIEPATRRRLERNAATGATVAPLRAAMPALRRRFERELGGALLLCPTVRHDPPRLAPLLASEARYDAANASTLRTTMVLSVLGACGISLPLKGIDGPLGMLISAPHRHDTRLLRYAAEVTRYTS